MADDSGYAGVLASIRDPDPGEGVLRPDEAAKWLRDNPKLGDGPYAEQLANIRNPERPVVSLQVAQQKAEEDYNARTPAQQLPEFLARRSVPVASSLTNLMVGRGYQESLDRFKAGDASEADIQAIADYQHHQKAEAAKGTGATILGAAAHIPAILGEAAMAAPVVRGLGLSPALLRGSAQAGEVAVSQMPRAIGPAMGLGARVVGGTAAQTAMMPSMWLNQSQDRALQNGGNWYDSKNLGPAGAIGMAQVAVLGAISRVPVLAATEYPATTGAAGRSVMASGVQGWVSRLAAGTVTGMSGQQGIDLTSKALGWSTSWGAVPDMLMGKEGGFKHFASQAVVFALFSGLHAHQTPSGKPPASAMDWVKTAAEAYSKNFDGPEAEPAAEAGAKIFSDAMKGTLTREAAEKMPDGPEKDLAIKIVDNLPRTPDRSATQALPPDVIDGMAKSNIPLENIPDPAVRAQVEARRAALAGKAPQTAQDATSPPEAAKAPTPAEAPAEAKLGSKAPEMMTHEAAEALAQKVAAEPNDAAAKALMEGLRGYWRNKVMNRVNDLMNLPRPASVPLEPKPPEAAPERWTRQEQQEAAKNLGLNQREFADWIRNNPKAAGDLEGAVVRQRNAPRGPQAIQPEPPAAQQQAPEPPPTPSKPLAEPDLTSRADTVHHIPDYKNPSQSVDTALTILGRKGSAPRPLETWDAGEGKGGKEGLDANFKKGHVSFDFDTRNFTGELTRGKEGYPQGRATSTDPLRYNPGLKGITYKGSEADPAFARLKEAVGEINAERSDAKLMREYGKDGALKPVELTATEKAAPKTRPVEAIVADVRGEQEAGRWPKGELTHETIDPKLLVDTTGVTPANAHEFLDGGKDIRPLMDSGEFDPIVVSRKPGGRLQVRDGDNRAMAAALRGDKGIKAVVINEPGIGGKEPPKAPELTPEAQEAEFRAAHPELTTPEGATAAVKAARRAVIDASKRGEDTTALKAQLKAALQARNAVASRIRQKKGGDQTLPPEMEASIKATDLTEQEKEAVLARVTDSDSTRVLKEKWGVSHETVRQRALKGLEKLKASDPDLWQDVTKRLEDLQTQALRQRAERQAADPRQELDHEDPVIQKDLEWDQPRLSKLSPEELAQELAETQRYLDDLAKSPDHANPEPAPVRPEDQPGLRGQAANPGAEAEAPGSPRDAAAEGQSPAPEGPPAGSGEARGDVVEPKGREYFTDLKTRGAEALKKRFGGDTLTSGFDPAAVPELAMYLAGKIGEVGWDLAEFTKFAVARFGETVRPHLKDVWDRAQNLVKRADEPMGAKNSSVDAERADRGLPPVEKVARQSFEQIWDSVKARMQAEPDYAQKLVADYTKRPRAFESERDQAAVLYERIRVQNEYDKLLHQYHDTADEAARQQLKLRSAVMADQLQGIDVVLRNGGSATGGVLNARRMMANEDFTLARMTMEKEAALGKKLTPEQEAEVLKQWKKLQSLDETAGEDGGKAKQARGRQQWGEELAKDRWNQKPWLEKGADLLTRIRRAFVLSSPVVFAKLNSAAAFRMVFNLGEEAVGAGVAKMFPKFGAKTMVEGGLNVAAEARAWRTMFTKGMKDAMDVARTGKSELDVLHGAKANMPSSWLDLFGQLHGALKAPVKRAFFERGLEKGATWAIRNGLDPNDPEVGARITTEAFKYAERSIFMQNNRVADLVERSAKYLERPDPLTGKVNPAGKMGAAAIRFALPIVKVPTNIVAETFVSAFGGITGSVSLARAYARGIESLQPEQADSIMRQLKKGSLGGAMLALGYALPGMFGGFHQPDEKRKAGDAGAGEMKVGDTVVPRYLLHNPLLEAAHFGATLRRVADTMTGPKKQEQEGTGMGVFRALTGLVEETPMARETVDLSKAFGKDADVQQFAGKNIKSALIPSGVDWAARNLDRPTINAPVVKRQTKTVGEELQSGIPWYRNQLPVKSKGLGARE